MKHLANETGIYSIRDLEKHYQKKTKGHWFNKDTVKFFSSRLSETLYYNQMKYLIYFVSSEQRELNEPRRYTVREYNPTTGSIETVGAGFQGYKTLATAKLAASKMVEGK